MFLLGMELRARRQLRRTGIVTVLAASVLTIAGTSTASDDEPRELTEEASVPVSSSGTTVNLGPRVIAHSRSAVMPSPAPTTKPAEAVLSQPIVHGFDSGTASAPTRPVHLGWMRHYDFDHWMLWGGKRSTDGGKTWPGSATVPGMDSATRRADGVVIDVQKTNGDVAPPDATGTHTHTLFYRLSNNDGQTFGSWQSATVNIDTALPRIASRAQLYPSSLVTGPDGMLYLTTYVNLDPDPTSGGNEIYHALLLRSATGTSWDTASVIATSSATRADGTETYTESAVAFTSAGQLRAVVRTCTWASGSCGYGRLTTTTATTPTSTWSSPVEINLSLTAFEAMIQPRLRLMPNGVMVLVAGRVDNWMAIDPQGTGATWEQPRELFRNNAVPTAGNPPLDQKNFGSSGNGGVDWIASNRVLAAADTCHVIRTGNGTTQPYQYTDKCTWLDSSKYDMTWSYFQRLVTTPVDVLTPGAGKLDLDDIATVQVANEHTTSARPRLGRQGAVDGSTETWSSAAAAGGQGVYTITLDKAYQLDRMGLSQWIGKAQTATVQVSTNGTSWSTWGDPWTGTSFAMTYRDLPTVTARHVRVTVPGASSCPGGMPAPCSMLNEIELYSANTQSFENDPVIGLPRDYSSDSVGVWVTDNWEGSGTTRSLVVHDTATVARPRLSKEDATASATRTLEFGFHASQWRAAGQAEDSKFLFEVLAPRVSGAQRIAFRFAVWNDGSIRWADSGNTWHVMSGLGVDESTTCTATTCPWSTIRVVADTDSATVSVNGGAASPTVAARYDGATTQLLGHSFGTSSTAGVDEKFVVDDVYSAVS